MTTTAETKARHVECSLEEYHRRPEWSHSSIETLWNDVPLFYGRHIARPPLYPKPSKNVFDDGTIAHACLIAPGGLKEVVAEIPREALNADGHRKGAAWKEWSEVHAGLIQRTAQELTGIRHMIRNVYAHPRVRWLLQRIQHTEFTLIWHDVELGLDRRARPDLLAGHSHQIIVVEYKTTRAITPREFSRDAHKYGYHRQIAWYTDGVRAFGYDVGGHVFVTSDKSPAHLCRVYELPPEAIELGREQNQTLCREVVRRLDQDDWSDPLGDDVYRVDLPLYAYSEGD